LPQGVDRSPAHLARFKLALHAINEWYAHPFTLVLLVTTPLPSGADYTNKRPYSGRGWCYFEKRIASLVQDNACLWDLSLHKEGTAIDFDGCMEKLKAGREPFVSPDVVARELAEGVASGALGFTAGADQEVVSGLYEKGFVKAFETFRQTGCPHIFYHSLGWGSKDAPLLAEALKYAHEHCKASSDPPYLNFYHNQFTTKDSLMLLAAAADESRIIVVADESRIIAAR